MTKERLEEIKDSIDFQLEVAEHIKADSVIECLNEEKELYNYVIELENMKEEVKEYLIKWGEEPDADMYMQMKQYKEWQYLMNILNKTNKE